MVKVASVDLKDAGVQCVPVPVFLPACVGNLEDARELIVNAAHTVSVHLELVLVQFVARVCHLVDVRKKTVGSNYKCKAGTCSCSSVRKIKTYCKQTEHEV